MRHSRCFCHFATRSSSPISFRKSILSSISISRISGKVQSSRLPLYGQSLNTLNSLSSRSLVVIRNRVSPLVISCQQRCHTQQQSIFSRSNRTEFYPAESRRGINYNKKRLKANTAYDNHYLPQKAFTPGGRQTRSPFVLRCSDKHAAFDPCWMSGHGRRGPPNHKRQNQKPGKRVGWMPV
jgi:hypothetical protein